MLVHQSRCDTSDVVKYIHTDLIQENSKFHKTTLPHDIIFTIKYNFTSYGQVGVFFREYNVHIRDFLGSLI